MVRRIAKTDDNQQEIINTFKAMSCSVLDLSGVGNGCPDLLVAVTHNMNVLVEVKDGAKIPSKRKLNKLQESFFDAWRGPCVVVNSVQGAEQLVNDIRRGVVAFRSDYA